MSTVNHGVQLEGHTHHCTNFFAMQNVIVVPLERFENKLLYKLSKTECPSRRGLIKYKFLSEQTEIIALDGRQEYI